MRLALGCGHQSEFECNFHKMELPGILISSPELRDDIQNNISVCVGCIYLPVRKLQEMKTNNTLVTKKRNAQNSLQVH